MDPKVIQNIRETIWELMSSLTNDQQITISQFVSSALQNIIEIGIISDIKPQYLLIANLLVLGLTKQQVIELVNDVYDVNDDRIKSMN